MSQLFQEYVKAKTEAEERYNQIYDDVAKILSRYTVDNIDVSYGNDGQLEIILKRGTIRDRLTDDEVHSILVAIGCTRICVHYNGWDSPFTLYGENPEAPVQGSGGAGGGNLYQRIKDSEAAISSILTLLARRIDLQSEDPLVNLYPSRDDFNVLDRRIKRIEDSLRLTFDQP